MPAAPLFSFPHTGRAKSFIHNPKHHRATRSFLLWDYNRAGASRRSTQGPIESCVLPAACLLARGHTSIQCMHQAQPTHSGGKAAKDLKSLRRSFLLVGALLVLISLVALDYDIQGKTFPLILLLCS